MTGTAEYHATVGKHLRDLDRQRAARLAALERFAADVLVALTDPAEDPQRLARITTAYARLVWSRP